MAKKRFYVDETRSVVKSEFYDNPRISHWIKHRLHQNNIKTLDDFVDKTMCKSSNPMFKSEVHCDPKDVFVEKTGKRIASLFSDDKKNTYELKQINRMLDYLENAVDVLVDYRDEIMERQRKINIELGDYKN